ncbi:hypothetical protein [Marimonas arenosa]|uniref:Uncharacterized protein n=1 Tax=Marimonas arenosa TaxID=1795305 RepID=A0AAE3WAC1_9RHOB|nr:hypothetical protein [Marimonas arenosa]MDQ2089491.1 hypothetical protein [Marimonas arenosa]
MRVVFALALCATFVSSAAAQQSPEFPRKSRFVIHLTSSQFVSGFGDYLVPPLYEAFVDTGLINDDGSNADYAATVQTGSDVGKWYEVGDDTAWLYRRTVTVGLSPADIDLEPGGELSPSFAVTVVLLTPNQDRVDELNCLITLATRELAARYRPKGHVTVDGKRCARQPG